MKMILPVLAVCVLLGACSTAEKYAANQAATESWLGSKKGSTETRIDGAWDAIDSGWGTGRFAQSGNKITGALGNYTAKGVLNGSTVYLAFESGGWTYYTATLKKRGDTLGGFYSSSVPFSSSDQSALTLRRVAD